MKITQLLIFFSLLLSVSHLSAQKREGNIVEYFGKEKVEDINEGEVIHLFEEGLILSRKRLPAEAKSVLSDPLFANLLQDKTMVISEGEEAFADVDTKAAKWEKIEISENSEFNDDGFRNGYLYLEYDSGSEKTVIFEASGHTAALINGLPHEGDHYDFGWSLIPVKLNKGKNEFILTGGRFSHMRARLLEPNQPVQFTTRDMTLPDVQREDKEDLIGGIRIMNSNDSWLKGASIVTIVGSHQNETNVPSVSPLNVRKVPFSIPVPEILPVGDTLNVLVQLKDRRGKIIDSTNIELAIKSKYAHHKKTFISDIDGSVQYYSVAPSLTKEKEQQALFLSVHGASVEAVNQANAYKQKNWGHLVAPTNRRPFGFAWEDWGRLDALEVLEHAENLLKTDQQHTYLTGHSMGGHGTWYLGATYPDRFAAIAPAAGYPDLLEYRHSFVRRAAERPEEYFERFGMSKSEFLKSISAGYEKESDRLMDSMVRRAGNPSRTLKLENNYLHFGIYVLHGEADSVVPTFIAREMRERLGKFHNDFAYYEYPDGTHWYGDHSVDWPLIFDFFRARKIKSPEEIDEIEFSTGSPGVSATSHFVTIYQQEKPFEISSFKFDKEDGKVSLETENVEVLKLNFKEMGVSSLDTMSIDNEILPIKTSTENAFFRKNGGVWEVASTPSAAEKGPHRYGGFKDAFKNNMVFVFATRGSKEENEWYYNRAKFDAEKFYYRANGNVELVRDVDFRTDKYSDRNVILYGNKSNNAAWNRLLKDSPIQVTKNKLQVGDKTFSGEQWGAYFIFPRRDSDIASVGVITATGERGMKGAYANDYLENGTFFPDVMIFDDTMMKNGISGLKYSGFFDNSWNIEGGDFYWRE
ncbi:alpha/beta hydrolase [Salinimicrobium sp. 3283s]|uniref:carboxylesterase family protein n=1 Tax=Salinimicrobium sp. 3283s TaxID=3114359 RepID=UPI0031F02A04